MGNLVVAYGTDSAGSTVRQAISRADEDVLTSFNTFHVHPLFVCINPVNMTEFITHFLANQGTAPYLSDFESKCSLLGPWLHQRL